jgi:hypothetical protein
MSNPDRLNPKPTLTTKHCILHPTPYTLKEPIVLEQGSRVTLTTDTRVKASAKFLPVIPEP